MIEETLRGFVAEAYLDRVKRLVEDVPVERVERIGDVLVETYRLGRQVVVLGNGGSAATASHVACDLAKSAMRSGLRPLRITCLNDNVPLLTALANDFGYEHVFSRQVEQSIEPGDLLLVISGSGRSPNVVEAMRSARSRSATVVALLGFDGGEAAPLADELVVVSSQEYGPVEDLHMILGHVLTRYVSERLEAETTARS